MNILLVKGVEGMIGGSIQDVDIAGAVVRLLRQNGFSYRWIGDILLVDGYNIELGQSETRKVAPSLDLDSVVISHQSGSQLNENVAITSELSQTLNELFPQPLPLERIEAMVSGLQAIGNTVPSKNASAGDASE